MNAQLRKALIAAYNGQAVAEFSAEDVNEAAIKGIKEELHLTDESTYRDFRKVENDAFALIEETVDEILPKKLENVLGNFAEIKSFPRDAEVVFNIERIGKNRAKLTISKGARGGIYRAARLGNKYFSLDVSVQTVAVYVTLEEILLGTMSLAELFNNILEGFEEIVYKEVFNALATGTAAVGSRVPGSTTTTKAALGGAIDQVMPYVKQYGVPTIFGSYAALSNLSNDAAQYHPELLDSADKRRYGFIQEYKGSQVVELPNYLVDSSNSAWFYEEKYVFVLPSGAKPVKVALKGDMTIIKNTQAVGSEKWEASKLIGVGVAMANNFAVLEVTDL